MLLGVALFVAVAKGSVVGWIGTALCGYMLVALLIGRLRPTILVIGPDRMDLIGPFGGRRSFAYLCCGRFKVWEQPLPGGNLAFWLTFDYSGHRPVRWWQRTNSKWAGANTQLRADGFELSSYAIAKLLNSYRAAALSKSEGA